MKINDVVSDFKQEKEIMNYQPTYIKLAPVICLIIGMLILAAIVIKFFLINKKNVKEPQPIELQNV